MLFFIDKFVFTIRCALHAPNLILKLKYSNIKNIRFFITKALIQQLIYERRTNLQVAGDFSTDEVKG